MTLALPASFAFARFANSSALFWNSEPGSPTWPSLISICACAGRSGEQPRTRRRRECRSVGAPAVRAQSGEASWDPPSGDLRMWRLRGRSLLPSARNGAPNRRMPSVESIRRCARASRFCRDTTQGVHALTSADAHSASIIAATAQEAAVRLTVAGVIDRKDEPRESACRTTAGLSANPRHDAAVAAPARRGRGRRADRRRLARALRDGCVDLPDQPLGVFVPVSDDDVRAAMDVCRDLRVPMLPRGAGSSQCGQTVGAALVIDHSKHLNRVVAFDPRARTVTVEPGIVLDSLNAWLRPHGLWFPVDVSTSAQCTLGGMAGNNSCGSRSLAYGNMVHNVLALDARLADGTEVALRSRARDAGCARPACATCSRRCARTRRPRARRNRARRAEGCCVASAAITPTSSIRKARGRTPAMAASTSRTCSSAAKARSHGRAR